MTQRIIGLTGGIATGKSTVSRYLHEKYKIPVLDADLYAREAVAPSSPLRDRLFQRYGSAIQTPEGDLDRSKLGAIIFGQAPERQWLEAQIHPYVRQRFERELARRRDPLLVLAIPLLFEAKMTDLVAEIWVVTCPLEVQIQRLRDRDGLTRERTIARIQSQAPLSEKIAAADCLIDNGATLESLYRQCDRCLSKQPRSPLHS
jgi:dephospho-CoA kinase